MRYDAEGARRVITDIADLIDDRARRIIALSSGDFLPTRYYQTRLDAHYRQLALFLSSRFFSPSQPGLPGLRFPFACLTLLCVSSLFNQRRVPLGLHSNITAGSLVVRPRPLGTSARSPVEAPAHHPIRTRALLHSSPPHADIHEPLDMGACRPAGQGLQ